VAAAKADSGRNTLAKVVMDRYDLGEVQVPEPLPNAHQRRHRKLVITTARGRFLVKTYKRDPYVLDALRFQHRLSDHLAANGLPVAHIQRARDGRRIVEVDDWALELQQFVDGEGMKVTASTLSQAALALGRFHEVCRDFARPPRDARMWRFSEVPFDTFARLYQKAKDENPGDRVDEQCNAIALFLQDAGRALSWEARNEFETGLIHGDWHAGNLIFADNKLAAILDLEFAGDGCYLEDLAYAVSNLCIRTSADPARLRERTDLLLSRYRQSRTLSFSEEVALYYAVGVKHITTVSYQLLQNEGKVAGYTPAQWMEHLYRQSQWLAERAKQVRWGHR